MSVELNGLAEWIYNRMTNPNNPVLTSNQVNAVNTILNIVGTHPDLGVIQVYERMASKGAVLPYVLFIYMPGRNILGTGGVRVMLEAKYQIKGITGGESYGAQAQQLSDAIDTALEEPPHHMRQHLQPINRRTRINHHNTLQKLADAVSQLVENKVYLLFLIGQDDVARSG